MERNPQLPDEDVLDSLLGRARMFILDLIALIDSALGLAGEDLSRSFVSALTRGALVPAEAALRRAILLIASQMDAPAHKPAAQKSQPPKAPRPKAKAPSSRPPVFRMSEPQPRPAKGQGNTLKADHIPEHLLPRIRTLTDDVLSAPGAAAPPPVLPRDPSVGFLRRFTALRQACDDPVREARRWLRRQASARRPRVPLSSGKIPGARRNLGEEALDLLRELTDLATQTLAPNSS